MSNLLSVNSIVFTLLGYPMSYIELIGTVLYLWSVWLIAKRRILTWPVGIVSVLLYMILFYQIQLYSDTIEQVYYLGASIYGWWAWNRSSKDENKTITVHYSGMQAVFLWIATTLVLSVLTGIVMSNIHEFFPAIFTSPASFPFLDALTTIMSFTAMWLMARRKVESWIYWLIVDMIGIWLYFVKDVKLISFLYVILLAMAVNGYITWHNAQKKELHVM